MVLKYNDNENPPCLPYPATTLFSVGDSSEVKHCELPVLVESLWLEGTIPLLCVSFMYIVCGGSMTEVSGPKWMINIGSLDLNGHHQRSHVSNTPDDSSTTIHPIIPATILTTFRTWK